MKGFSLIIVGYQGAGKSLLAKNLIKKIHPSRLHILDIYNEYDYIPGADRYLTVNNRLDFDRFKNDMVTLEGRIFIAEDATIIFSHRGRSQELLESIIGKRHSQNTYIFLFHSLRAIPRDVFDYSDQLWLLKTGERSDIVESNFKGTDVIEVFEQVKNMPEFEWSERQPLPIADKHYKVMQIKKGKIDRTVNTNVE